ncbi:MAG TPA: aspartate aminotransferase family protein [Actinomycetota bacterium]
MSTVTGARDVIRRAMSREGAGMRSFIEDPPFVWERASGAHIEDADGRRYIDLYAAFAVAAVGHQHPKVVEAVREQAGDLMHCSSAYPSRVRADFYDALASIALPAHPRFLPAITGSMANEVALTIARVRRPRAPIVAFEGGYLGRSVGTVGYAGKARYRDAVGVAAQAQFAPYPRASEGPGALEHTLTSLERLVDRAGGVGEPAAVVVEPVQGNGGVVVPPEGFLPALRELCDRTGALLIVDEIQAGCGRTGRMWATEHSGVVPDLMTVGKGIGGGLAAAAVLGTDEAMSVLEPDAYSSTFLTNNLNLAAAVAAIGVLRDEDLPARAATLATEVADDKIAAIASLPGVGPVQAKGLWYGLPIVDDDGRPDARRAKAVAAAARERGVIVGRGGYHDEVVKVSPPLVIERDDLTAALDTLGAVIAETD